MSVHLATPDSEFASNYAEEIRQQRADADGPSYFPKMKRAPLTRKRRWERKLRHQSRVERRKELPKVKEGKLLGRIADENEG